MMKNVHAKLGLVVMVMFLGTTIHVNGQGKTFKESDETIVMEAEHYYELKAGSGDFAGGLWHVESTTTGYTGSGYIQAPDYESGIGGNSDIAGLSPAVIYKINFTTPGIYYWYARCTYNDGASDSYHLGMGDSVIYKKMNPWTQIDENYGSWGWNYNTAAGEEAVLNIPSAGEHNIVVYMREGNFMLDKIILTTDPGIAPTDLDEIGPQETVYTRIKENAISKSMSVYPNPVKDNANITFEVLKAGNVNVSVYNLSGQMVKVLKNESLPVGTQQISWNVAGDAQLQAGLYLLKIDNAGETAVRKVVIQ